MAALNAMDIGRKHACQLNMPQSIPAQAAAHALPPGQQQITDWFQPAALTAAQQEHNELIQQRQQQKQQQLEQQRQQEIAQLFQETKQHAVLRFWELLADFVAMHAAPEAWCSSLPVDHPFLCTDSVTNCIKLAPHTG